MATKVAKQKGDDFMKNNWRPMMAITYMLTCLFDFVVGPVLYNILQFYNPGQHLDMWQPLTLQGGGLYHIAMGVVLGITAHGRTQEKINSASSLPGLGNFMPQPAAPSYAPAPVAHAPAPVAPAPAYHAPAPVAPSFGTPAPVVAAVDANKFGKVVPQHEEPVL